MNRREWLRNASLIAAGTVAADQIGLLEMLFGERRRKFWPGWSAPEPWPLSSHDIDRILKEVYRDAIPTILGSDMALMHAMARHFPNSRRVVDLQAPPNSIYITVGRSGLPA